MTFSLHFITFFFLFLFIPSSQSFARLIMSVSNDHAMNPNLSNFMNFLIPSKQRPVTHQLPVIPVTANSSMNEFASPGHSSSLRSEYSSWPSSSFTQWSPGYAWNHVSRHDNGNHCVVVPDSRYFI